MDYPRMLYLGGDRDAEFVTVNDEADEATQRKAGYLSLRDAAAEPKAKPSKTESKAK